MIALKRRSFRMAGVLGDLGADWHILTDNYLEHTAYEILERTSDPHPWEEQLDVEDKRTVRSLLRLYDPARG
jgi:hypothetical protein